MISCLLDLLREGGVDEAGADELADVLWLAQYVLPGEPRPYERTDSAASDPGGGDSDGDTPPAAPDPDRPATPPAAEPPTPPADDAPGPPAEDLVPPDLSPPALPRAALHVRSARPAGPAESLAAPVRVPAEAALPHSLELARALKPLTRKVPSATAFELDEEATVARLVDENIMVPVLRPEPSRWLTVTLVVDTGPSMTLWRSEVRELEQGLARLGAFRDIRRWNLSGTEDGSAVELRPHPSVGRPPRHHLEIVEPTGHQLIVVVSDTVGSVWHTGAAERLLLDWAHRSQVAVAHLLPAPLWNRGGATPTPASLHIPQPGAPNARWGVVLPDRTAPRRRLGLPVPVVDFRPRSLRAWADMTAGSGRWTWTAAMLLTQCPTPGRGDRVAQAQNAPPPATEELIHRFRSSSSPTSWQLAGYLSALSTVTLPVARLVQQAMLGGPGRSELAEVFLGGLLHRTADVAEPAEPCFEFLPEVREALLNAQYSDDVSEVRALVRERVSERLESRYGQPRDFAAALTGEPPERATVPYAGEAFATPSEAGVTQLGAEPAAGGRIFVSHAEADREWAQWVTRQLEEAGYRVEPAVWRLNAGDDLMQRMNGYLARGVTVALFSTDYFGPDGWSAHGWQALMNRSRGRLIPIRVGAVGPSPLLRPYVAQALFEAPALFGLAKAKARQVLLDAVASARPSPPDEWPPVSNLPEVNPRFVGREVLLGDIHTLLADGRPVALVGPGGVGKSELAVQYAHRYRLQYELAWWVDAQGAVSITHQLATLAFPLDDDLSGPVDFASPREFVGRALRSRLRGTGPWLIVFDGAESYADLADLLPTGNGHVLITSRSQRWPRTTQRLDVPGLTRDESLTFLRNHAPYLPPAEAGRLAQSADDLPQALVQAVEALEARSPSEPSSEQQPFTRIQRNAARLRRTDPEAADLLNACVLLAPEPFPINTLAKPPFAPPGARLLTDRLTRTRVLSALSEFDLAEFSSDHLQLRPSTIVALREGLTAGERGRAAHYASQLLEAAAPGSASDPAAWPRWAGVLPHLLAIEPTDLASAGARLAALDACRRLSDHGDTGTALGRLQQLYLAWSQALGADHQHTLWAGTYLAQARAENGDTPAARSLLAVVYSHQLRALGANHPDTLRTARLINS
ncbi:toll/interleukin-1 receptor domain-containing protein [Streptomyces cyaneus]|uniref:toll/interleukin-1 receptor domain-containing protein n=1 Tax=Streptomyces cyaneus TaxID=1904 RepID=UPI000FF8B066|nr:toll/interleukin-1 receptor domain-containing protein [Streptomyces cyaneus]